MNRDFDFSFRLFVIGILVCLEAALIFSLPNEAPGQFKWFLVACISSVITSEFFIRPNYGLPAALLFGYCVINASWFWIWKDNRYFPVGAYDQLGLRFFAADGIAKLLLLIPPILLISNTKRWMFGAAKKLAAIFCFGNVTLVYFAFFFEPGWCQAVNSCGGSLSNPSMNASATVCALPFLMDSLDGWKRRFVWIFVAGAIFLSKSSVGIGLFALCALFYAVRFQYWKSLAALPFVGFAGFLISGQQFLSSNGRFLMWDFFMTKWWANPINYTFGTGYGTFGVFSANLQLAENMETSAWWVWMHNDWLEILFTLGVVGLFLSLLTYLDALKKLVLRGEYTALISLLLFGIVMGVNYPLHSPISAIFGAWLILFALQKPEDNKNELVLLRQDC